MDPISNFLTAVQPFRDIHGEITACFANQEAGTFHELWWSQHGLPLPLYGVRAKMLERLDLDAVPGIDGFPTSLENFLDTVSPIFDQSLLQRMAERASRLDHVSGVEMALSDIFIRRQTHRTWAFDIITAIATRYYERTKAAHQGLPDPASLRSSESSVPDLELDPLQPIEQITLCGPTMLEAWSRILLPDAEDYIRAAQDQVRQFARLQLDDDDGPESKSLVGQDDTSDWSPFHGPCSLPVFHGTHAGCCGSPKDEGKPRPSRAIPAPGTMPIMSTGFHAFKTYLHTAFRAEVISNLFAPPMSSLAKRWTVNEACWTADEARKHFAGVILSRFQLTSEQHGHLTPFQVPVTLSSTGAWQGRIAEINEEAAHPAHAWARIFGLEKGGAEWPNVLHFRDEVGNSRVLGARTEEWLTYWCGEGVSALKRSRTGTFAVSFLLTTAPFSVTLRNRMSDVPDDDPA